MTEFILWGLGVLVGFIGGQLSLIFFNYYTTYKENQKNKQEFLKTQTERMKQNIQKNESKQN